jgi:thermostable 8-oxoguanine DNA glycosylase
MANMYSIAELIDKLIIENIKIFRLRENLHKKQTGDQEYVDSENKMNMINQNRGTVIKFLDLKIEEVLNGQPNSYFVDVKTYANNNEKKKQNN